MLTIEFVPYRDLERLSSDQKIKKLLKIVKENKIVLMEGRLKRQEEADLIKKTMQQIDEKFKGIELATVESGKESRSFLETLKRPLITALIGDRQGMTVIGPASIIKEIKKDPNRIQLLFETKKGGK